MTATYKNKLTGELLTAIEPAIGGVVFKVANGDKVFFSNEQIVNFIEVEGQIK